MEKTATQLRLDDWAEASEAKLKASPVESTPNVQGKKGPITKEFLLSRCAINSETGCWEWQGGKMTWGYANIRRGGKWFRAHRKSYELFVAAIPKGLNVLHHCDNRGCLNPEHLFLGTQKDNMQDAAIKGRTMRGERHTSCRLTANKVLLIRRDTRSHEQIASDFGVVRQTVTDIKNRRTWDWLL